MLWLPVLEVFDSAEYQTVYDFRVADFHTYIVSDSGWDFSVSAHNTYESGKTFAQVEEDLVSAGVRRSEVRRLAALGGRDGVHGDAWLADILRLAGQLSHGQWRQVSRYFESDVSGLRLAELYPLVPPGTQPNEAAASLLAMPSFQRRALSGVECAETAEALQSAAGGCTGGTISISGPDTVRHPTKLGVAESNHHQVFTDGYFVFDPVYSSQPISRAAYEAHIRQLNRQGVEIGFFPAQE